MTSAAFASIEAVHPVALSPTLIVEDDPAMRERLRFVLAGIGVDARQIAIADSVGAARELLGKQPFGIALVDIGLPDGSGVDLIAWLQHRHPDVSAVVISAWRTDETIFAALRAGAIGYLLKEREDAELGVALRSIEQGGASIDPSIARRILSWVTAQPGSPQPEAVPPSEAGRAADPVPTSLTAALSPRERKILELVSQGLSNRDMAELLSISRLTVECHTKNIYRKLAVNSRTEAVYQARKHGLLD
ncbi:response regulator transcription factor [Variovorax sp. J31P179]|uniref:response regulator transcription factor n=1 Tax=Variovorax sp. J31P179 TaxID=3053508 RepID=UPI002575654F|nr:response regulator transcription factor [Variovorax sp. J31P179]MDM0085072.1 response regulator transcription factor [Variovorax sp. J31P179]